MPEPVRFRWLWVAPLAVALQAADPPDVVQVMEQAAQRQRDAVRGQARTSGDHFFALPWPETPPAPPACDPIAAADATRLVAKAAASSGLQPELLRAVITQESGFRPCAVSHKGAQGLMQLMPAVATELGVRNAFDPEENTLAGARHLKALLDKNRGDTRLALAAYNAGQGAVEKAGGLPDFAETRDYVARIMATVGQTPRVCGGPPGPPVVCRALRVLSTGLIPSEIPRPPSPR